MGGLLMGGDGLFLSVTQQLHEMVPPTTPLQVAGDGTMIWPFPDAGQVLDTGLGILFPHTGAYRFELWVSAAGGNMVGDKAYVVANIAPGQPQVLYWLCTIGNESDQPAGGSVWSNFDATQALGFLIEPLFFSHTRGPLPHQPELDVQDISGNRWAKQNVRAT